MKIKFSIVKTIQLFVTVSLLVLIFSAANYEAYRSYQDSPKGTQYQGAIGFFFDYYQFLSWIRDGRNGQILINSRYVPEVEKPVLLHPFFPLVGLVIKPFGLSLPVIYHLVRNLSLGFFLWCLYVFIKQFFNQNQKSKIKNQNDKSKFKNNIWFLNTLISRKNDKPETGNPKPITDNWKILVIFFIILFVSSFPKVSFVDGQFVLSPLIDFWKTFYPLERFAIPPHHLLADGIFILLLKWIIQYIENDVSNYLQKLKNQKPKIKTIIQKSKLLDLFFLIFSSICLVMLNPGMAVFLLLILAVYVGFRGLGFAWGFIVKKRKDQIFIRSLFILMILLIVVLPYLMYLRNIFTYGNPWKHFYDGEKVGRYLVSQWEYVLSLGPFFFTAFLSLFFIKKFKVGEWLLLIWLILPVVMFPYVGRQIPIAMSRLFSYNLFIPAGMLTVYYFLSAGPAISFSPASALSISRMRAVGIPSSYVTRLVIRAINILLGGYLIVSTVGGFWVSFQDVFGFKPTFYYNVFLPDNLVKALEYIDKNDTKNMTVLAGENVSNLVPVFTDMHAVNGRRDAHPNWGESVQEVDDIYSRKEGDEKTQKKMDNWDVKYLVFGIDHISIEHFMGKSNFPIREVFRSGNVVVGEYIGGN